MGGPIKSPQSSDELVEAWREIGLSSDDIQTIQLVLARHGESRDVWLAIAAKLRPAHVFDATYYHCAELTYRYLILSFEPTSAIWGNYGVLLQEWGRYTEAIRCHERALGLQRDYGRALANLGFCYELAGDLEKATAYFRRAINVEGTNPQSLTGIANCNLRLGRIQDAIATYEAALLINPDWRDALYNLAIALGIAGRWDDASSVAARLQSLDSHDECIAELAGMLKHRCVPEPRDPPRRPFDRISRRMVRMDKFPTGVEDNGPWGWVNRAAMACKEPLAEERLKLFLSYRWSTPQEDEWVERLAQDLSSRGYRVVLDKFSRYPRDDPGRYRDIISQLGNTALFAPILTEGYRRRVEAVGDIGSDVRTAILLDAGRAFDEWAIALVLASLGRLKLIGVWRSGAVVPVPFTLETVCDFRRQEEYDTQIAEHFPGINMEYSLKGSASFDDFLGTEERWELPEARGWPADLFDAYVRLRVPRLQQQIVQSGRLDGALMEV